MRPECKEGLRRVGCLQSMQWARQLHGLALWPTALHLSLLDRKFGGALTRADTLGVDGAEEDEGGAASAQPPLLVLLEDDAPPGRCLGGGGAMSRSHGRCGGWHGATRPAATPVEPADVLLPQCVVRACVCVMLATPFITIHVAARFHGAQYPRGTPERGRAMGRTHVNSTGLPVLGPPLSL